MWAGAAEGGGENGTEPSEPTPWAPGAGIGRRLRDRLAKDIAAQKEQVDAIPTEDQKRIVKEEVDLNGVDPVVCILGSVPTAALSFGFWELTGAAAEWFLMHPVETDFYPAQRLGVVFQTAVVALSSLAAGIFGFTALGILLLGIRVAIGVASGELDPKREPVQPMKQSTAERVRDLLTRDPVEVVMEARRRAGTAAPSAGAETSDAAPP